MQADVLLTRGVYPDLAFIDVRPGDWVVLKPNLIKECKENNPEEWKCVITSPELIAHVCRYVCNALRKRGRVTICDAPQTDSTFARISDLLNLHGIATDCTREYQVPVEVLDLRKEEWTSQGGVITSRRTLPGDPNGAIRFDLGKESLFYRFHGEGRYYGADYDSAVVNEHHQGEVHEYLISATPVLCDVFINLPKMKTHKKTGVTLSLKNLVGINADKNWLPHHTVGSPDNGGDQYPRRSLSSRLENMAANAARAIALRVPRLGPALARTLRRAGTHAFGPADKTIRSGNWYGNDTTWRMVLDLNRCLLFGNPDGTLRRETPKRYYTIIDGIIGMQGSGPMQGDPIASNITVAGIDPVAVDIVATRAMGFDWHKVPMLREAISLRHHPLTRIAPHSILVSSNVPQWCGPMSKIERETFLTFAPHFGWRGHIEYDT